MLPVTETVLMFAWGDWSWLTGAVVAAGGLAAALAGLAGSLREASETLRMALRIRRVIWGVVLVMLGAGVGFQWPVLVVAALVIGFEETIETGIVVWALRHDPAA